MLKRLFNITVSFLGLIILSPLFVVLSIAILLDSKGGVFYKQWRVGKTNTNFRLYKFRSMTVGADKKGLLTVGEHDARITSVGKFIRQYKLDELPQLINVLIGNMNLVGPRPEVRKYVDLYTKEQQGVLKVKPGITDYASIEYKNENEILSQSDDFEKTYIEIVMPHKLELNKKYINDPSIIHDIKLIYKTLFIIFK
ncbi:MAG: sugar transferase [Bacteroidales bacterium]|nr:sugar transferase [Bacteroidales bacterium]